jgi:hypothetical protein
MAGLFASGSLKGVANKICWKGAETGDKVAAELAGEFCLEKYAP